MAKPKTAASHYARLTLRLPDDLLRRLRIEATTEDRPLNTHVVRLLRRALMQELRVAQPQQLAVPLETSLTS